jgi:toxin ParE1/3/4
VKQRAVIFAPEAETDLNNLYDYIQARAGEKTALNYISRVEKYCSGLDLASERGTLRDDIRQGLRVVGFERRLVIAFAVEEDCVMVLRLFSGGLNWEEML